jgi:hypothetical protein
VGQGGAALVAQINLVPLIMDNPGGTVNVQPTGLTARNSWLSSAANGRSARTRRPCQRLARTSWSALARFAH